MVRTLAVLSMLLPLACCAGTPLPEEHFYRMAVPTQFTPSTAPLFDGTIEVERFRSSGLVSGRAIVYAEDDNPHALNVYNYHSWSEPPALMLRKELIRCLQKAGVATTVVTTELRADADYVLVGAVDRLERVVGSRSKVVIEVDAALRARESGKLLLIRTYRAETSADGDGMDATIAAFDTALGTICERLVEDLRFTVSRTG